MKQKIILWATIFIILLATTTSTEWTRYNTNTSCTCNVFTPQYVFSHTNETIELTTANVWENITFQQETADIKYGIMHNHAGLSSRIFNITQTGIYNINYDIDVEDTSASATNIGVAARAIHTNGTEIEGSVFEADLTKQGTELELSHNFLAQLTAGNQIIFQFVADDADVQISTHGTFGEHPESATIVMNKISNIM